MKRLRRVSILNIVEPMFKKKQYHSNRREPFGSEKYLEYLKKAYLRT